jgi:hypothetical protein
MLSISTEVQVFKSGAVARVEDLEPGDTVYNPVTGQHTTLVNLMKRQILPAFLRPPDSKSFMPVRVPAHALGARLPSKDLFVSPAQVLLVRQVSAGHAGAEEMSALSLCEMGIANRDSVRSSLPFTYFALLFENPTVFIANGVFLLGCQASGPGNRNLQCDD